jgi:NADH:ubiquinone oxidoreductase subunit H
MFWNLLRRWIIVAIAVPLAAVGVRKLSGAIEKRRGPSRTTSLLRRTADVLQRRRGRRRGLLRR